MLKKAVNETKYITHMLHISPEATLQSTAKKYAFKITPDWPGRYNLLGLSCTLFINTSFLWISNTSKQIFVSFSQRSHVILYAPFRSFDIWPRTLTNHRVNMTSLIYNFLLQPHLECSCHHREDFSRLFSPKER